MTGRSLLSSALTAVVCAALSVSADTIVIRHDKDDAVYRVQADAFPSLVLINRPGTHGTLIAASWVLTAGHVAHRLEPGHRVTIQDRHVVVRRIVLHPGWRTPQTNVVDDLALLELDEPVAGVTPVPIYRDTDEVGEVLRFVGRGGTGNGRDGLAPFRGGYESLRAATNRVERADGRWLVFRFDPPATATELEGISGPGDSGGPAFIERNGRTYLAGVSSWQDSRAQGREGVYGVTEYYARVSSYADWLDGRMKSKSAAPEQADAAERR